MWEWMEGVGSRDLAENLHDVSYVLDSQQHAKLNGFNSDYIRFDMETESSYKKFWDQHAEISQKNCLGK